MKTPVILFVLAGIAAQVQAVVESMGSHTVEDVRSALNASDFKLNLRDQGVTFMDREEGWRARLFDLKKSPVLGGRDVQLQFADATIRGGSRFLRHYHPRSSEIIFQRRGRMRMSIEFENGSVAANVLERGDLFVIPQGLVHDARCLSKRRCTFVASFRTADPGLVQLPFREE